jgi:NADH dehydrogenase
MSRFSPFLPLIGGGKTLFQPAYVVDVAKAIVASLSRKETQGKIYELGGSSTYSFRELMEFVVKTTGNKARLLTIPFPLAKMIGFLGEWMPRPILTRDQVKLLQHDNLVQPERDGFTALTIKPTALEMVVPAYLQRFSRNPSSEQIVTTDPMKSAA